MTLNLSPSSLSRALNTDSAFRFPQDVAGLLYAERRGKGLHLLARRRERHALVFRFAAHSARRDHMQRHGQHGAGQRVVRQLESLLHGVQVAGREPVPGHHIVRQHRPGVGGHIRCEFFVFIFISIMRLVRTTGRK